MAVFNVNDAVLVMVNGGVSATWLSIVYVTAPCEGKFAIVSLNGNTPEAAGQTAPLEAAQVHAPELIPGGMGSATTAPSAATRPVLVATTV